MPLTFDHAALMQSGLIGVGMEGFFSGVTRSIKKGISKITAPIKKITAKVAPTISKIIPKEIVKLIPKETSLVGAFIPGPIGSALKVVGSARDFASAGQALREQGFDQATIDSALSIAGDPAQIEALSALASGDRITDGADFPALAQPSVIVAPSPQPAPALAPTATLNMLFFSLALGAAALVLVLTRRRK